MNVLDSLKHSCFECFVKYSKCYFLINMHVLREYSQEYEPQLEHIVIYQVLAATIKQLFWSGFNYV